EHGSIRASERELPPDAAVVLGRRRAAECGPGRGHVPRREREEAQLVLALEDLATVVGMELDVRIARRREVGACAPRAGLERRRADPRIEGDRAAAGGRGAEEREPLVRQLESPRRVGDHEPEVGPDYRELERRGPGDPPSVLERALERGAGS